MAVYFKFLSARDYDSVAVDGPFISLDALKQQILESKYKVKKHEDNRCDSKNKYWRTRSNGLCLGTDLDLQVFNAQTNEEYLGGDSLILINTRVLLRRVPGNRRRQPIDITPIVVGPQRPPEPDQVMEDETIENAADETDKWDDFGDDIYFVSGPAVMPDQTRKQSVADVADNWGGNFSSKEETVGDENRKSEALVNTSGGAKSGTKAIASNVSGHGRSFVRAAWGGFRDEKTKPVPEGYVCRRCNISGHFIHDCPTNGDPNYDFKRVRRPAGIPKSMLEPNPNGTYKLSNGACAVLKPNEAAFDREMDGLSSSSSSSSSSSRSVHFPPEFHCPLCKQVMKDAVFASKCCFRSFCDKCIRDQLITHKLKCFCGVTGVLADYLLPNITVRDAIKRILESGTSAISTISNEKTATSPSVAVPQSEDKRPALDSHMTVLKTLAAKAAEVSKIKLESALNRSNVRPVAGEEEQQNRTRKEKRKTVGAPKVSYQAAKRHLPSVGPCAYTDQHRINGMQLGMNPYAAPSYAGVMPYTGYGY